jgi:phosphomannomutase
LESNLKFSVSGLRGIVGKVLGVGEVIRYSLAFSSLFSGNLALGRDTRKSGGWIKALVEGTIISTGNNVYDFDIIPTPALLRLIGILKLDGGIMVSASHNPPEWNALKFAFRDKLSSEEEVKRIQENLDRDVNPGKFGRVFRLNGFPIYFAYFPKFDLSGLRVALDFQNGATAGWVDEIFKSLGAEVITFRYSGDLPENPEPSREKFEILDNLLKEGEADVAFGFDPDGDRVICGIRGFGMLSEEQTTALALYSCAKNFEIPRKAVLNLSTSIISERVLEGLGFEVVRWKVGEPNIVKKMEKIGAKLGGEGNGGLIYYDFTKGRDGLLASVLIAKSYKDGDIPEDVLKYPFEMVKIKFEGELEDVLRKVEGLVGNWEVSEVDGYYYRKGENWVHIRPSNTEPVLRVVAEGERGFLDMIIKALNLRTSDPH